MNLSWAAKLGYQYLKLRYSLNNLNDLVFIMYIRSVLSTDTI